MNADLFLKLHGRPREGNEQLDKAGHLPSGQAANFLSRGQVVNKKQFNSAVLYCAYRNTRGTIFKGCLYFLP